MDSNAQRMDGRAEPSDTFFPEMLRHMSSHLDTLSGTPSISAPPQLSYQRQPNNLVVGPRHVPLTPTPFGYMDHPQSHSFNVISSNPMASYLYPTIPTFASPSPLHPFYPATPYSHPFAFGSNLPQVLSNPPFILPPLSDNDSVISNASNFYHSLSAVPGTSGPSNNISPPLTPLQSPASTCHADGLIAGCMQARNASMDLPKLPTASLLDLGTSLPTHHFNVPASVPVTRDATPAPPAHTPPVSPLRDSPSVLGSPHCGYSSVGGSPPKNRKTFVCPICSKVNTIATSRL